MIKLYQAIKEKLGTEFPVTYQTMREDKEGVVGIYLYESSNDVEDLAGDTVYESIKCHIQVNATNSEEGIIQALTYLRQFVDRIETENSTVDGIDFVMARHIGPRAICIGKNGYNIQVCVCNIDIKYILD